MNKVKQWIEQEFSAAEAALQRKRAADDAALKRERADADLNRRKADARERLQTEERKAARLVAEADRNFPPKPEMPKAASGCGLGCLTFVVGFIPVCLVASICGIQGRNGDVGAAVIGPWFLLSLPIGFYGIPFLRQLSWKIEKDKIMENARASADQVVREAQAVYNAEIKAIESSIAA